jgi:uncharacterized membrane protein
MKDRFDFISQVVDVLDKRAFLLTLVAILLYTDCYLLFFCHTSIINELAQPSKSLRPHVWLPGCLFGVFGLFVILPFLKLVVVQIGIRLFRRSTYSSDQEASTKESLNRFYVKGDKLREMGVYQQNSIAYEEYKQYLQDLKTKQRIQDLCGIICILVIWNMCFPHSLTRILESHYHLYGVILPIVTMVITFFVSTWGWLDYIRYNYEEFSTLKRAPNDSEPLAGTSLRKLE